MGKLHSDFLKLTLYQEFEDIDIVDEPSGGHVHPSVLNAELSANYLGQKYNSSENSLLSYGRHIVPTFYTKRATCTILGFEHQEPAVIERIPGLWYHFRSHFSNAIPRMRIQPIIILKVILYFGVEARSSHDFLN